MKKPQGMRCPSCDHQGVQRVLRNVTTGTGAARLVIRSVEVEECPHCGERLYDLAALRQIRAARRMRRRPRAA